MTFISEVSNQVLDLFSFLQILRIAFSFYMSFKTLAQNDNYWNDVQEVKPFNVFIFWFSKVHNKRFKIQRSFHFESKRTFWVKIIDSCYLEKWNWFSVRISGSISKEFEIIEVEFLEKIITNKKIRVFFLEFDYSCISRSNNISKTQKDFEINTIQKEESNSVRNKHYCPLARICVNSWSKNFTFYQKWTFCQRIDSFSTGSAFVRLAMERFSNTRCWRYY